MPAPEHQALDRDSILAQLSRASRGWLRELRVHAEIDSTNSHLIARAANETIDGVACIAERQTGGRGRRGRTWLTPPGSNIALSLGKSISIPISEVAPLSLVVGLAAVNALARVGVNDVKLKWPNDVLLNGAKVGGILIELAGYRESAHDHSGYRRQHGIGCRGERAPWINCWRSVCVRSFRFAQCARCGTDQQRLRDGGSIRVARICPHATGLGSASRSSEPQRSRDRRE